MRVDDLEKAKAIFGYYFLDLYFYRDDSIEIVTEQNLNEVKEHRDFIKSIDFRQLKAELLKKIDCEIAEIREALDENN